MEVSTSAAKKQKLTSDKYSLKVGESATLKYKNAPKKLNKAKVKWSISSGKNNGKIVVAKNKKTAVLKALKQGKVKVQLKYKGKKVSSITIKITANNSGSTSSKKTTESKTSESDKTTEKKTTPNETATETATEATTSAQTSAEQPTATEASTTETATETVTCLHEWETYGHTEGVITGVEGHAICLTCGAYVDTSEAHWEHNENYHSFRTSTVFVPVIKVQYIEDGKKCSICGATEPADRSCLTTCDHEWHFLNAMILGGQATGEVKIIAAGDYCPKCEAVRNLDVQYMYALKHPETWNNESDNPLTEQQGNELIDEWLNNYEYYDHYPNKVIMCGDGTYIAD